MGTKTEFDSKEAAGVESLYQTDAAERRRRFVRTTLEPQPGERVLSIGCGPGFEPVELADAVTSDGRVDAIDASEPMIHLAKKRCEDHENVTVQHGLATELPVEDGAFDAATSVQVFEYIEDLDAALSELERVLRPGGRAAVYATDWDSLVWNAADRERSRRVADAWADHCPRPHLGSDLRSPLRSAGLSVDRVAPFTIVETELEDTFAGYMRGILRSYATEHDEFDTETPQAWGEDLRERDRNGETLFSLTAFLYLVSKPE
ncbi:methyltransferase domain-containing protein [Natrinema halophilum]|uniref:Methyltransferase domain-containing protein n=1 Tax=Natrinema halophilum TaxID=1699371 RepID=A0A7D5KST1_9EURY|nr:methyltransferase domain-containing protein [Natrinema halophilum]QLG49744.1 methyltransferase domain-containing protein [Natrinema halophilum]